MTITDTITRTAHRFDLARLTHVDLSKLDLPKFDLPQLAKVDLPVDGERVAGWVRDAAYVGVGAAVVVGQHAEQRVRTLATAVSGAVSDAMASAGETVTARVRAVTAAVADAAR